MKFIELKPRFSITGYPALNLKDPQVIKCLNKIQFGGLSPKRNVFTKGLPRISKFRSLFESGCEVVHGIPFLYENVELGNIRLYVGRTTKNTFLSNASFKVQNGFDGIVPLAICEMSKAKKYEKLYQKIVFKQIETKSLCVGGVLNKRAHGGGPELDDEAVIYIAWKLSGYEAAISYPDSAIRKEIIETVTSDHTLVNIIPGAKTLGEALRAATRICTRSHLFWRTLEI